MPQHLDSVISKRRSAKFLTPKATEVMEGLSIAANGLAVVSVAFRLTEACIKLYRFWESVEGAPHEIATIKDDLQYLISIFKRIESSNHSLGDCIVEGIQHCQIKVLSSRGKQKWTAFKAATQNKHVQRFRESLSETKSTLTLALVHQCVVQSRYQNYTSSGETAVIESPKYESTVDKTNSRSPFEPRNESEYAASHKLLGPRPMYREQLGLQRLPVLANDDVKNVLMDFEKPVPVQTMATLKIEELMLQTIRQTAIATFESDSLEILAQDGYTMDDSGTVRTRTFVYSENLRYRVRHHMPSFQTAFGCVWIRTTVIYLSDDTGGKAGKNHSITSFVFYPTRWVKCMGIRNGLEAILASAGRSWVFNCRLAVTRAVPEDSLIFEFCRTGQTRAVQTLLKRGLGSVVDTSPKGWKPLHFAAAGGHVDLCATLIEAGADKSALVYEGPTASILSPISLFVACSSGLHADVKISMLRLFSECIDLADASSEGWTVHEWLKRSYAKEKVPISQNSITWLLLKTANEEYVQFNSRTIWSALQHALRTVLCHERHSRFLLRILDLSKDEEEATSQNHLDSIALLIAFRVSGRVLLPMIVTAGSFLQLGGFDWEENDTTHRQYLQALPAIYAAGCRAVLDSAENMEQYMQLEFEQYLQQLGWTREGFLDAISHQNTNSGNGYQRHAEKFCTKCANDYNSLPSGLVAPVQLALTECAQTSHKFHCACHKAYEPSIRALCPDLPEYSGLCFSDSGDEDSDADEEFHEAEPYPIADFVLPANDSSNLFSEVATLLYRTHGRVWMGEYGAEDHLCASCFLLQERYIGEDGLIADFPPMPKHFDGLRFKW
ncbi:hypothetical protein GQ44DRAFT_820019 [Phaeosphaeriaceae sp. PMI808]|nr:hypothetical protein GQ44DRAFT_820019 [Phaeosphaeriaceae sp. PMI808]